jgi:hypothetical protein
MWPGGWLISASNADDCICDAGHGPTDWFDESVYCLGGRSAGHRGVRLPAEGQEHSNPLHFVPIILGELAGIPAADELLSRHSKIATSLFVQHCPSLISRQLSNLYALFGRCQFLPSCPLLPC